MPNATDQVTPNRPGLSSIADVFVRYANFTLGGGSATVGRGSNQGNTQNEKSLYHQSSIDFRCYLEMARFEPRQNPLRLRARAQMIASAYTYPAAGRTTLFRAFLELAGRL